MSQLILEFALPIDAVLQEGEKLSVELGNGVRLTSSVPTWVVEIKEAKLQLIMEVTGAPNANTSKPSVQ